MSLSELYEQMAYADLELEKEAGEMDKLAAEEDAAGRITARGFMDELTKLARSMLPDSGVKLPSRNSSRMAGPKKSEFIPSPKMDTATAASKAPQWGRMAGRREERLTRSFKKEPTSVAQSKKGWQPETPSWMKPSKTRAVASNAARRTASNLGGPATQKLMNSPTPSLGTKPGAMAQNKPMSFKRYQGAMARR